MPFGDILMLWGKEYHSVQIMLLKKASRPCSDKFFVPAQLAYIHIAFTVFKVYWNESIAQHRATSNGHLSNMVY